MYELGVVSDSEVTIFGDGQPVEGIKKEQDIIGEDADNAKDIVDDVISQEVGVGLGDILFLSILINKIMQVDLCLSD